MAEYYDIYLTDMQLHVAKPTNPPSFLRQILKSFRKGGKPGRVYHSGLTPNPDGKTFHFSMPLSKDLKEKVEFARRIGKEPRFIIPKGGIPVYLGKDSIEKIESLKKKGLLNIDGQSKGKI